MRSRNRALREIIPQTRFDEFHEQQEATSTMLNERNSGIRSLLSSAAIYRVVQSLFGVAAFSKWLSENHWRISPGTTVVDVGCGPASLRSMIPHDVNYYGFDPNPDYIAVARRDVSGFFHIGTMSTFLAEHASTLEGQVDTVVCSGVLHHLSDVQIEEVLAGANRLLKPAGRFVALEPAFSPDQSSLSRWVVRQDRGTNVLTDQGWLNKLQRFFVHCQVKVVHGKLRIPYTHALLSASQSPLVSPRS